MTDPTNALTNKTDEAPGAPIRVLIAEDQALLRTSFAALAGAEPDLEVVGRAADGGAGPRPARHRRLRDRSHRPPLRFTGVIWLEFVP